MPDQLKVFISYSHKDEEYKAQLLTFMAPLIDGSNISQWNDEQILPGQEWDEKIQNAFREAEIIILLISPEFLASNYIIKNELPLAIQKHRNKEAHVIPIFIRPCHLKYHPEINDLEGLPKGKKPVSKSDDKDSTYLEIVEGIDKVVQELTSEDNPPSTKKISELKDSLLQSNVDDLKSKKTIYLAVTSKNLKAKRRSLFYELDGRREYDKWPYSVIPNPKEAELLFEMEADKQKETIQKYIDDSLFSINLIDTGDEDENDIIDLQYDLAKQKCSGSLYKCLVGINSTDPEHKLYKAVEEGRNTNPNIIKITSWDVSSIVAPLDDLIIENERKIDDLKTKINPKKSVFLFYGSGDKENQLKEELKNKLRQHNYNVRESVPDYAEVGFNPKQWEEDQLRKCEGAIILYGSAAPEWFTIRKHILMDYENTKWKAVCIDEPNKDEKYNSLKFEPGLNIINSINELQNAMTNG